MYHHLRGVLVSATPGRAVIETAGVGWDVRIPLSTADALGAPGGEVCLLTHLVVKEDSLSLFGFATEDERTLFQTLIGLSGVGASTAIQILSSIRPADFLLAIEQQDAAALKKIKGIGDKTAKRIILELKGAKMRLSADADATPALSGVAADAAAALEAMGVSAKEAVARVERVLAKEAELGLEETIRRALQG